LLHVLSDLLLAVDRGDVAALVLLDLTAAFDTVDHDILLRRLSQSFGMDGSVLCWFRSYLAGRSQAVHRGQTSSTAWRLSCGLPQGSVLGPILFILYAADLPEVVQRHGLSPHLYADDTQVYGSCPPGGVADFTIKIDACLSEVRSWMSANRLQLNAGKTEFLWCSSKRRQHQLPTENLSLLGDVIKPATSVRDLGIFVDADLSLRAHVTRTVSRCFHTLRQLRSIRRSVPTLTFRTLVTSLVVSRLDYGNAVLYGLPKSLLSRLQSVLNAAARLIYGLRRGDRVTDALISLHWLCVPERIRFKVAVTTFRALHGRAPHYLSESLKRVADLPARRRLRSSASNQLMVPTHHCSTIGGRAFSVAGPTIWNALPQDVTSADSLPTFKRRLKTYLFRTSYDI
jgi:hypothetical protein